MYIIRILQCILYLFFCSPFALSFTRRNMISCKSLPYIKYVDNNNIVCISATIHAGNFFLRNNVFFSIPIVKYNE